MKKIYITKTANETKKLGQFFAKKARVIGLQGNLGSGKTTFLQGFAKGLGVKEKILSPTFVILKRFKIKGGNFYHIDCYRLKTHKDLILLGIKEILADKNNVIAMEWPMKQVLPKDTMFLNFKFIDENKREITVI